MMRSIFSRESGIVMTWRRLKKSKTAVVGLGLFVSLILMSGFASYLAPYDPVKQNADLLLSPPTWSHPFGTDQFGRDLLSRVIHGGPYALMMGTVAVAIALSIGVPLGLVAGYYGGRVETVIMRIADVWLAFPGMIVSLVIITILGRNLLIAMFAVGLGTIPGYIRQVRGLVLKVKEQDYVEAARASGTSDLKIIFRHILPNVTPLIIILATLTMPSAMKWGASLSFLGLGANPPTPEWGYMLSAGRSYLASAWWIGVFPGLAIFISVLGLNLFGDGLRDALDPRLKI